MKTAITTYGKKSQFSLELNAETNEEKEILARLSEILASTKEPVLKIGYTSTGKFGNKCDRVSFGAEVK